MKVTVFGPTGGISRLVVAALLADGHTVTAYVRNPDKLDFGHPQLSTVTGTLYDAELVRQAVHGADAVISALGPSLKRGTKGAPVTDGTKNVVAAMNAEHVSRFIGLATPSIPDDRDRPTLKAKILPIVAGLLFPNALDEIVGMTTAVTRTGLDWTIARPPKLTPKPYTGKYRVREGHLPPFGFSISHADAADFMIKAAENRSLIGKVVGVCS